MKQFWKILSGNKTIICTMIFGFVARFGVDIGMSDKLIEMILWFAGTLGLGSFGHHIQKKKFTAKSN